MPLPYRCRLYLSNPCPVTKAQPRRSFWLCISTTVKGLGQNCFAKDGYDAWAQRCEDEDVLPFQAFEVDRPPRQKLLPGLVHKKKTKNISQGSTRMRIFRENMSLPRRKTGCTAGHGSRFELLATLLNSPPG